MRDLQKIIPTGGLNYDDLPEIVDKGDYVDALNIRHLTETGGSEHKIHKILGNDYFYEIPDVATQNKIYRIPTEGSTEAWAHTLTFKDANGDILATVEYFEGISVAETQANATNVINVALSDVTITNQSDHITVEITTTLGLEYYITCSTLDLIIQQEAIDDTLSGIQTEIGSKEILDNLYVLNTTEGGVGEYGVVTYDIQTDTSTYTRLLRSKELNFSEDYQIDVDGEYSNKQVRLYPTDNNNPPMVFYHKGSYSNDCALEINGGIYNYGKIAEKIKLFISKPNAILSFLSQSISGGNISSGNWRYTIRLLDENYVKTTCLDLSNSVPAYTKSPDNPNDIIGDKPSEPTPKLNNFEVTNIDTQLYKYIELIGINYVGEAPDGYMIKREIITGKTMLIEHTGHEPAEELLVNEVNAIISEYETAKNVRLVSNRLVLSNLTLKQIDDFSDWAKTIEHSIDRVNLLNTDIYVSPKYGEYQKPENCYFYVGFMHNETYRWGVKVDLINGNNPYTFWVDDIKFDTNNTTPDGRRVSGLTDYSLFTPDNKSIYSAFVRFSNIDLDHLIDGVKVRDLIEGFSFVRVECVPEVLATGISVLGVSGTSKSILYPDFYQELRYGDAPSFTNEDTIGEYPFFSWRRYQHYVNGGVWAWQYVDFCPYPNNNFEAGYNKKFKEERDSCFFYSPDIYYNHIDILYSSGDKLINIGTPKKWFVFDSISDNAQDLPENSAYSEYLKPIFSSTFNEIKIINSNKLYEGAEISMSGKNYSSILGRKYYETGVPQTEAKYFNHTVLAIKIENEIDYVGTDIDYGIYYCQYFREKPNKYGDKKLNKYVPTGHYYKVTEESPSTVNSQVVFGGDTFTQKSYIRNRDFIEVTDTLQAAIDLGGKIQLANGFAFYSQNRVNTQMRITELESHPNLFPGISLKDWFEDEIGEQHAINRGYGTENKVNSFLAYNPDIPYATERKNMIIWSDPKLIDSYVDNNRIFGAFSFRSLDLSFGEIIHQEEVNGELITWQVEKIERQYFNERGSLVVKEGYEVMLGDAGVMAKKGMTLSSLGCQHKWSIIKGKTEAGNDIVGWINQKHKMAFKLSDRIYAISNRKVRSWFNKNLNWVTEDTPANGLGICGVWNGEHSELIWTVRGRRTGFEYDDSIYYYDGDVIFFVSSNFQQSPSFYIAGHNQTIAPGFSPDVAPLAWDEIPHTNTDYYNEWTLVFSEFKDRFTTPLTPLPKIYLQWRNTYLCPSPSKHINKVYRNNKGELCEWFRDGDDVITAEAFIEGVINKYPDDAKWYANIELGDLPKRIEFETKKHISYLDEAEFEEEREDHFVSEIKEDSTISGVNYEDTGLLLGKYLKVKIILIDKVFAFIVKFRISPRVVSK